MRILNTLLRNEFLADVAKLSTGTLLGRLISIAILPILTRLYSPDDFAVLAVYLAVLGIVSVAACLRLEIAIPIVESEKEGFNLLVVALGTVCLVTLITSIPIIADAESVALWFGTPALEGYLWLVPLGVALTGSYSAFQYWATRTKRFGHIARTRVTQSLFGAATMLSMGWLASTPLGLLLGSASSAGVGSISLALRMWRSDRRLVRYVSFSELFSTLRRQRRYPLLSTPEALLNVAGQQVPVLVIATYAAFESGFLLLSMQLIAVPMVLLGGSISQAYLARAPQEYRECRLAPFTMEVMQKLVLYGVGPLALLGAIAPLVFPIVFGSDWVRAGEIVTLMIPWMIIQFIISPVSMVMLVVERQSAMLLLTALGLVLRVGGVFLFMVTEIGSLVLGFVVGSVAYYILVAFFVLSASGLGNRQSLSIFASFADWRVLVPSFLALAIIISS